MVNLKSLRAGKKMSQKELAQLVDCDRTLIGKIENGTANITVDKAKSLAVVFNIHWTQFFDD